MPFLAVYDGYCHLCMGKIREGQMIESTEYNGMKKYQHCLCPEPEEPKPTRFQGSSDEEMGF